MDCKCDLAQLFTLQLKLLLLVVRRPQHEALDCQPGGRAQRRHAPQLCHSKRTRLKKLLEKWERNSRVAACHDSTLSPGDIVWRPAWRATAQQQRNRCRRGSLLTLRLSRNAKNEQQSGSHKTSDTAAKGLISAEQRELYCSQEVLRLSRISFPAGGVALTTCHRGST